MIYFDNAATGGFKAYSVQEVVSSAVRYLNANPTRSGHKLAAAGGDAVFRTRKLLSDTFNNGSLERTIFTKNCTEALNTAIFGTLKEGDGVIYTCMEHNSVIRPVHKLLSRGVKAKCVFSKETAFFPQKHAITFADIEPYITADTRLVITNQASNVNGQTADVHAIGMALKKNYPDVIYMVDGAQSGGHVPIDMCADGIDILCLAGHKGLGGIMGSGALLFTDKCDIEPLTFGGTGTESFNPDQPDCYPERLESGTLNLPAIIALYEGVQYVYSVMQDSEKYLTQLTKAAVEGLENLPGVRTYSSPNPFGIVAFEVDAVPSQECSEILSSSYDIAVRGGFHCAPLMHEYLHTEKNGLVRISLSNKNTFKELNAFLAAMAEICKTMR